ncbi:MAG TPA: S8 family peptidase [Herpetosiphonaceae bacterium]
MQRFLGLFMGVLLAIGALTSTSLAATPAKLIPAQGKALANQYIVVLKDGPSINAGSVAQSVGVRPRFVYDAAINGFAATLNAGQLTALRNNPRVAYIEQDAEISSQDAQTNISLQTTQTVPVGLWGLDRSDQPNLPLSGTYVYTATAPSITAYVIDTGISNGNVQFSGRAASAYDAFGGNGVDCHGFGTHLAGTIGGTTYGMAKAVRLRGVRVLDCFRTGSISTLIAGMNFVQLNATKPAVAIVGAKASASAAIDTAATNLINAGVFLVTVAGEDGVDACNYSPSRVVIGMTVGASTNTDTRPSWSNYGPCVDLHAPGVSVLSSWINGGTNTLSGTAMAAAHVTGCAAKYKATYGDVPQSTLNQWLTSSATVVNGIRILYCPL